MKKLAIIGASYLQRPLVEKAREMGLYTICFAWADGAVCRDVADKFYDISIVEKEKILSICREEKINGICTIASDVAAPTVAYIAEQMGLIGNSYKASLNAYDKSRMRTLFCEHQIPSPKSYVVTDSSDVTLSSIHRTLPFPLIIKPTDRSGSMGVAKVVHWKDLSSAIMTALDCSFSRQAMVEEFIEGREISMEFISYQGQHYPLQITDKVTTEAPHFVELAHHQPSTISNALRQQIIMITKSALQALGITNGASHSEYRITEDGRIAIIEIGGRMGGDFIGSDLVQLSTGYDFVRGVIEVALGEFTIPKRTICKNSGVYFICKETEYLLPEFDRQDWVKKEMMDTELHNVTRSADRSGYFIYQSEHKIEL